MRAERETWLSCTFCFCSLFYSLMNFNLRLCKFSYFNSSWAILPNLCSSSCSKRSQAEIYRSILLSAAETGYGDVTSIDFLKATSFRYSGFGRVLGIEVR